ncbi:hypothetical protein ACFQX6_67130 [Streptosporangium lutulentum]
MLKCVGSSSAASPSGLSLRGMATQGGVSRTLQLIATAGCCALLGVRQLLSGADGKRQRSR